MQSSEDRLADLQPATPPTEEQPAALTEENRAYSERVQQGRIRSYEREEEWRDEWARIRLAFVSTLAKSGTWMAKIALIVIGMMLLVSAGTFTAHLFLPQFGWLTAEEQSRLTSWYTSVARTAFPLLLIANPWLVWRISRSARENSR